MEVVMKFRGVSNLEALLVQSVKFVNDYNFRL